MSRRTLARQAALQVLYQDEFNPQRSRDLDRQYILTQVEQDSLLSDFTWWLVDGTRERRSEIDPDIELAAEHWSVYRMSAIDLSLLRMATFECRFGDTPKPVAIDEAIRLAKRFGGKDSPAFVNGVLDRILSGAPPDAPPPATSVSAEETTELPSTPRHGLQRFLKRPTTP
jgi:transcription antitermination protein NusB